MRATFPILSRVHRTPAAVDVLKPPIVSITNATFYKQQPTPINASNPPWFPNLNFSLPSNSENPPHWSVVSPSSIGKTTFLEVLRGQHLCFPPQARLYPYLSTEELAAKDPQLRLPARALQYVGFSGKSGTLGGSGTTGAYLSARYESRRESMDFSLLDYLKGNTNLNPLENEVAKEKRTENLRTLQQIVQSLKLESLLDLPVSNLSNGQTRRARIAKALMGKPEVILLDEPFMGLDPPTLSFISSLLYSLAEKSNPRVIMALRPQDPIPEWTTHVMYLNSDNSVAHQGPKETAFEYAKLTKQRSNTQSSGRERGAAPAAPQTPREQPNEVSRNPTNSITAPVSNEALVEMEGVEVRYGDRQVLGAWQQNIDGQPRNGLWWTVRRGERWGIFGPNGSGKTTVLSLICSDHPQTYSLPIKLFGCSRLPTPGKPGISIFDIQSRIGHSSPEVHQFFPRDLTIRQTLENAWADTFRGKAKLNHAADMAVEACLRWFEFELNPAARDTEKYKHLLGQRDSISGYHLSETTMKLAKSYLLRNVYWADQVRFRDLSISGQRVALFIRAVIKKPDLVILDEAFSGMDTSTRDKCMLFLAHGENRIHRWTQRAVTDVESPLVMEGVSGVNVHGLEERQALICISHLEEEVPSLVKNWMCLPEPNEGKPVRFGRIEAECGGQVWWDEIWAM